MGKIAFQYIQDWHCWNLFGIEYAVRDVFLYSCFLSLFLMQRTTQNFKYWNTHKKEFWTHEIPTRNVFRPTKYLRENLFDLQNPHLKNFSTHEILKSRKLDSQNAHKKNWIHEKRTRKTFGATKYARSHDSTMVLDPRDPRCKAGHEI